MRPREIHIFDMDGTLVDTFPLVVRCYRQAAKELKVKLPEKFWGRSASEWGCSPELHLRKTELYLAGVQEVKLAWAAAAFNRMVRTPGVEVRVWTGASWESVMALTMVPTLHGLMTAATVRSGMSMEEKHAALRGLRLCNRKIPIHYYDDNRAAGLRYTADLQGMHLHTPPVVRTRGATICE